MASKPLLSQVEQAFEDRSGRHRSVDVHLEVDRLQGSLSTYGSPILQRAAHDQATLDSLSTHLHIASTRFLPRGSTIKPKGRLSAKDFLINLPDSLSTQGLKTYGAQSKKHDSELLARVFALLNRISSQDIFAMQLPASVVSWFLLQELCRPCYCAFCKGLSKRVVSKPGKLGGGRSIGMFFRL